MSTLQRYQAVPRSLCFIFHQRKTLLIKASNTKQWSGIFNPIGGHIEPKEDILESAIREIREESGLSPLNTTLKGILHVTNFFGTNLLLFITTSSVKSDYLPITNHPEGTLEWVNLDQLSHKTLSLILNHS